MSKLDVKQQILILVAVLVAMIVIFVMFAWNPQKTRLTTLEDERQAEVQKIEKSKATLAALEQTKQQVDQAQVTLIKIENQMPTEAKLPELIIELQNIANDAGVDLLTIRPGELKPMGEYSEMTISASIVGSYVSIIDFLARIEKAPRALKISTLDIRVESYPDLTLNIVLSAFTMGSPGQSAAADTIPIQGASAASPTTQDTNQDVAANR